MIVADDHRAVQDGDRAWRSKTFTVYRTHHGPIVREADGKWVAIRLMQEPVEGAARSRITRTKARDYKAFRQTMELHTNSSNNTIFADADGDIAYFHGNFIPRRDTAFDWTKPVDGSDPATDWHGCSGRRDAAPAESGERLGVQHEQLAVVGGGPEQPEGGGLSGVRGDGRRESARGLHAIRVLQDKKDFTLDVAARGRVRQLPPGVREADPGAVKAWDAAPAPIR